ncbi:MAG: DUF748 domain-containing protein [Bacteroidota bacterium]
MRKWMWFVAAFVLIVLTLIVAIPPGLKWYLEEHDQELIGRELTLEDVSLNLFTGRLGLQEITLYEANATDTFFFAQHLGAQLAWTKLFRDQLHMREIMLDAPKVRIIQQGSTFNFDDLIQLTNTESEYQDSTSSSNSFRWQIDTISLKQGTIHYQDQLIGSQLVLDSLRVAAPQLSSQSSLVPAQISFNSGEGTWTNEVLINLQQESYTLRSDITNWSLQPFTPYVLPHIGLADFGSQLGAQFSLVGSYAQTDSIALNGTFQLQDFRMTNLEEDSLLAWNELSITIDSANTATQHYNFGNIKLERPYLLFELSPQGDNFTQALQQSKTDSLVQQDVQDSTEFTSPFEYLALYIYELTQAYLSTSYVADTISVEEGVLEYQDYTLNDPFSMYLSDLSALATDISQQDEFADFDITSKVNRKGDLTGNLQISRSGINNMELNVQIQNLAVGDLNAYTTHYMGHPFLNGDIFFVSNNSIKDYYLESKNNLFVGEIEVGDKTNQKAEYRVPMKLAVALLRDTKGNVDLDVPINGDLNDPDYYLGRIILKVIANVLVKAATSPYRLMANLTGGNEEDFKSVNFDATSYELTNQQERKLRYVVNLLEKKPELKVYLDRQPSGESARQIIALAEAKKEYWFSQGVASQDSSWLLQTILDPNDSSFVRFLESALPTVDTITEDNIYASCQQLISESRIDSVQEELWRRRKQVVSGFFQQEGLDSVYWNFRMIEQDSVKTDTSRVASYLLKYQLQEK